MMVPKHAHSAGDYAIQESSHLPCPVNIPHGFMALAIPEGIQSKFQQHIVKYFRSLDPTLNTSNEKTLAEQLTHISCTLTDDEFIKVFIKGLRTFPGTVSQSLLPWLESDIKQLLGADQLALTRVSKLDLRNNPSLAPEDYDVYWRCVRPNKNDIARPHTDSQFAHLNEGSDRAIPLPFDIRERWRIWFPLFGCHQSNSIQLVKDSYRETIPFTSINTINGPRPSIKDSWLEANEHRFECPVIQNNNGVLFRDDVVHRGPVNTGPNVRISAEFTIVIK